MRRAISLVTAMVAAFMMSAGTASAATGVLYVGDEDYHDPEGCYVVILESGERPHVYNNTDEPVEIYSNLGCNGTPARVLQPREGGQLRASVSLWVD
ncbi:hypothetical protein [Saccharothrix hoggarensis]|uniref:Secreted protein n=1 Tax=Saccharothrix hoggarensis TaxID=913853 RepID=A0ABW3R4H6_9PSEU